MADWMAFAEAFFNKSADYINERKDNAEEYSDRLRENAERNKSKLSKLRQAAQTQKGFINQAKGLYATDAQIEAALDSGPTGLQSLVQELSSLKSEWGNDFNADLVAENAQLPAGFKATGNIDPDARYGLNSIATGDYAQPTGGWLQRALGKDAKSRVRYELDQETVGDTGMSVYDLAELSDIAGYESLSPTSFLSYVAPKRFNPTNFDKARENIIDARRAAILDPAYKALEDRHKGELSQIMSSSEKAALQKKHQQELDAFVNEQLKLHVNGQVALYGESYLKTMAPVLSSFGIQMPTEDGDTGSSTLAPNTSLRPKARPELIDGGGEEDFTVLDEINVKGNTGELVKTAQGIQIRTNEGVLISPAMTRQIIDDTQDYSFAAYEADIASRPELQVMPEDVTTDEKNESLKEPFKEGDPRPKDSGMLSSYLDKYRAKVWDEMFAETHNPDGTRKDATPQEKEVVAEAAGGAAEKLLKNYGKDIIAYMDESGIVEGDSDEDIKQVLADWYGENSANKELLGYANAVNDDAVIYAIRLFLNKGE